MTEPLALLREAHAKAEAKANRLRLQLNAIDKEAEDLATAIRVLERLSGGEGAINPPPVNDTAAAILAHVGYGPGEGRAPIMIFEALMKEGREDLNADLIRTQLWRMARRGTLVSENGRYWRPEAERPKAENVEAPDAQTSEASNVSGLATGRGSGYPPDAPEGSIPSSSTTVKPQPNFDTDIDDDVPF